MKRYLLVIIPVAAFLAGCLGDTIIGPQVQVRPIFPPDQLYYRCFDTINMNLEIRWNPPLVDTQNNFKGYFIELFNSLQSSDSSSIIDSTFGHWIDSVHVAKTDTMYIFRNKGLVVGKRYTVQVWGERVPSPSKPDSLVLSIAPAQLSLTYDDRPVYAPTMIFANSAGPSAVNLWWSKSTSDAQIGMAGYIIRYKDTTRLNAPLLTYIRIPKNINPFTTFDSLLNVTVSSNTAPPVELPFKFWIKAVRQDSTESADSIGISWSGAELIPPVTLPVKLDTALFLGVVGFGYNMVQVDPGDPKNAYLQVTQSGGNIVIIAKNNTMFVNRVDHAAGLNFTNNYFAAPFLSTDFSQTQISFPATGKPFEGSMIYALFPGGNRARILFQADSSGGSYIRPDNTIPVQASFQPAATQLPFF